MNPFAPFQSFILPQPFGSFQPSILPQPFAPFLPSVLPQPLVLPQIGGRRISLGAPQELPGQADEFLARIHLHAAQIASGRAEAARVEASHNRNPLCCRVSQGGSMNHCLCQNTSNEIASFVTALRFFKTFGNEGLRACGGMAQAPAGCAAPNEVLNSAAAEGDHREGSRSNGNKRKHCANPDSEAIAAASEEESNKNSESLCAAKKPKRRACEDKKAQEKRDARNARRRELAAQRTPEQREAIRAKERASRAAKRLAKGEAKAALCVTSLAEIDEKLLAANLLLEIGKDSRS